MKNPYLLSALIIFTYMTVWYVIAQIKKDNGIVDIAWGPGFVLIASVLHYPFQLAAQVMLMSMIGLWGFRLGIYIFLRNRRRSGEDWRYRAWREEWGKKAPLMAFLKVFMLQGAVMWIVALPLMQVPETLTVNSFTLIVQSSGLLLWLAGFLWEAIADGQLMHFKADPENKGKIMTRGLWKYSRHPNYFGEIVLWWGIFLFVIPFGAWYLSLLSPLIMTWLLNRVSGVPMLERKYEDNADFQAYKERTNALIPTIGKKV